MHYMYEMVEEQLQLQICIEHYTIIFLFIIWKKLNFLF